MASGLQLKTHLTIGISMHKLYETVKVKNWWQVKALEWKDESVVSRKVVATAYDQNTAETIESMLEGKAHSIEPAIARKSWFQKLFA